MTDSNDEMFLLGRRALMMGTIAAGAASAIPALGATPAAGATSGLMREQGIPSDPATRSAIVRRMRHRTDAGLVFWWFRGRNYAQQGATLTPMCELIFGAIAKIIPAADGTMDIISYELGFRTAPDSGERADKLRNPITVAIQRAPRFKNAPMRHSFAWFQRDLHEAPTLAA